MTRVLLVASVLLMATGLACKKDSTSEKQPSSTQQDPPNDAAHTEDDGHDHSAHGKDDGHDHDGHDHGDDHGHDHGEEVELGTVKIGDMKIIASQGHGKVQAGQESHLVVKLPYNDKGATIVRAWLGTKDRTRSLVGKAKYAASHDDYDLHAMAPNPLPKDMMWWIEIQKPDGSKVVGSIKPLVD